MILFILFAAIRYLLEVPFTDFCRCVANTYIHFRNQPSTIPVFANLFTRFDGSRPIPTINKEDVFHDTSSLHL